MALLQRRAGFGKRFSGKIAFPEGFENLFQLSLFSDGRETENVGSHGMLLSKELKGQSISRASRAGIQGCIRRGRSVFVQDKPRR